MADICLTINAIEFKRTTVYIVGKPLGGREPSEVIITTMFANHESFSIILILNRNTGYDTA